MIPLLAALLVIGPPANGTTIHVRAGEALVVRLPGNATTGYRWAVTHRPPPLRLVHTTYVAPKTGLVGSGGTYVFRFSARPGSGTLTLAYRRPWEKQAAPLRTFRVTVRVR